MKKWIKYLMLIFSIFMVGTLSACTNNKVTDSKVVPTYKGMVVERDNTQQLDLPFIDDDDLFDDDDDLDDDIEDLVTIKIITDDSIKYNVLPGEVFNLHVKLENPDEFEIQSFKLNGKKYANYMFEDGSDMENLYLKVIAPMEPGYYDYTIDAIKYIDGDDIEDVNLSKGNQSIKVGVRHAVLPTVNDVTKIVDTTKIALQLTLNDKDNLLEDKDVKIYLSNGKKVIDEQPIKLGVNNILFDNLKEDKLYQYAVMTSFDLCDGEYEKERTLFKETVRTKGIYSVSDALISQESIEFSLTKNGEVGELTTVSLHDKENKYALVENLTDLNNLKFSNLLSNHNYTIKVAYNYKINNVDTKGSVLYHFITKEKIAPTLTYVNVIATQDKIDFDYKVIDHDSLLKINSIALYDGSKIVKILTNLNERSFDKLLSNHNYMIRIDYSYDLNNGNGINKEFITYEIKTEEKLTPKVNIINTVSSQSKIDYDIDVVDMDKTYHLEKVELYLNSKLVDRKLVEEPFEGLLSNTKYELKVTYSYDLNDEMGKKFVTLSKEIMTKEKIAPKVNIQNVNTNQDAITFEYEITNTDVLYSIKTIELYKGDKLVNSITELDKKEFINLLSNTDYTIKIIYSYDLNDGKGKQESIATTTCHTKEKMAPTVTIENIIESQTTIEFNTNVKDLDGVYQLIKIDLYDGSHLVKSLTKEDALLFDGLYSNRAYTIKLVYSYDLNDGSGVKEVTVSKDAITLAKVAPTLTIKDVVSTQTSINYNYDIIDTDNILNIDKIELLLNGEVVDTKLSLEEFTGLLSGKEYVLRITYSYDLNEGTGAQIKVVETNLKTLSKVAPKVEITNTTSTQTSINYDVTIDDKDGLYVFNKVELYLGEQLIKSKKVIEPFEGLLSGKKYTIEFTYSYNLNDGTGFKEIILSKNVITVAKNEPVVEIKYLTSDQTSVSFNIDVQDIDSIYNLVKVELYKNGELVKALENLSHREFIDLLSNTEYVVKVTYSYDLNDGKGVQTKEVINSIFTKEKVAPKVEITNTTSTQTSINYDITIDDKDGLYVFNKVDLYLGEQLIESKQELKPFEGLLSGKKYTIRVTYSFNLNDGKGNQTVEVSKNIFTKEKIAPVVEINNTSSTNTSIYYEVNVIDREGIYVFDRVELYLSGKLVETKTSLEAFNNLLSNKQYTIRVIYKYDLNDGNGLKEYYKEANQITKEIIAPNVTFNNIQSTHTSISYEVNVVDNDGIFVFNRVELYLGQKLIETKKDFTAFTGLYSNRIYTVKVYYTYNLNDGNGVQEHAVTFNKQTLSKETPMVSFTNVTSTQSEIYYEVNVVDKDKLYKLKEIQLLLNGEVVDTKKAIESFTGLLSNTEYVIKVIFTYDLNDGRGIKELSVINKVQTLKKNEPFVQIKYPSSDKTSVSFTIDVDDVDSTYNLVKVELYKNGELVKALENLSHREFIDLLSNTEYVVKVTYSYNLNDGTGVQTNTIETNIKTLAKVAPKVSLSNYDITDTYITADIDLEDVDNIARITKVELYKGNQFFAKNDNLIVDFRNLDYYNNYLIKITYSYDLNEGNGLVTSEFRKSLNTKPYFKLSNFKIINTSAVSFGETIYVQATLDNPLNATYTYIVINGKQYEVAKTSTATRLFVDIVNNGQFEGGDTLLTLESVTTVLNGQTFDVIIDANNTASVFINGSFSVESFKFVDSKLNEIDYTLSNEPVKVLLTVNNKTGYNIDRLSYRAGSQVREVTTFEKIDDNRFLFNYSYYSVTESNEIRITHISYSNQYISKSLNLEDINKYKSVIYLLKGTKHISTIEDLKHVDENYYYILDNDIDLAGIEWRAIYNMVGILDGNNHAILNMTYSTSVKNKTENLGLFDYCSGIVKNLNIKNVLIRAETIENGQINVGILTVNSSRLTVDNCSIDENSIVSLSGNVGPIGGYIGYSEQLLKFKNSNCKANIQGPGNVAGFVGYSMNDIYFDNCYNAGNIIGQSAAGIIVRADNLCSMTNCYNSGYIDGRIYAAGLVNEGQDIKITNCYNTGKIKGGKAGGILGQTISNSSLTNCYNIGEVEGIDAAGGLIANGDNTILTNCYNAGLIKSADYGYKGGLVGGYMGSKPEIINSYTTNVYNIFDVIVTLEQLNEKMFYVDTLKWDETIWNLDALDVSNGIYPILIDHTKI